MIKVVRFEDKYRSAFREMNLEWISKYFKVEDKDLDQLEHPERILEEGGEILVVLDHETPIGVCALIKLDNITYELAKMAVIPSRRGAGIGHVLMIEAERVAKDKGAKRLYLISNTTLESAIRLYKNHGFEVIRLGPHPDYERGDIEMEKRI